MVGFVTYYEAARAVTLALAFVLIATLGVMGYRRWARSRITPEERERLRRAALVARGKMGDATVVEFREGLIFYSYSVRGVVYTASQDTSGLEDRLPADLSSVGAAWVKYDPRNPANSIIFSEEWNGLRARKAG
jgi:hypothetical protein